jgi:RNA polymerase sigma-70 factor (ECF subfamily)
MNPAFTSTHHRDREEPIPDGAEPMSPNELETWLERLHEESFGWALSCCGGDRTRAEDVLQSAYVRVISGRAVYGGRSLFRTWLFGVIRRVALEENRRVRTDRARTLVLEHPSARNIADENARPDEFESARALHAALARLPDRQRAVLHLVFYQDMSIAEAAVVMEITVGSARTHYERGKAALRSSLGLISDDRPAAGR